MADRLCDLVAFRGDRLFHGAVNVDWFDSDPGRATAAAQAFVFHGPKYHGVQQQDVGTAHGHALVDTATLARTIVRQAYGRESEAFTLAIAGYGTGKSHFALTLATLLDKPKGPAATHVLGAISAADAGLGADVAAILKEERHHPSLVIALNGMQSFDLTAEVTRQVVRRVQARGLDARPVEDLRPRFGQAASLVRMANADLAREIVAACEMDSVEEVQRRLEEQDESTYANVQEFFAARGMPIRALSGESVRDVLDVAIREYCGRDKPFRSLIVLFDEFGRYTEFATLRSHIAGSGALQDLFEVIQAHEGTASFIGFIQFELNTYVQRITPEYRNEILRYVTRYQTAKRVYLSINLETLIANLIEKREPAELEARFATQEARAETQKSMRALRSWFPQTANHRLWTDQKDFHTIVRQGCWPLTPFSTWFLFYLASAGKHLQERSALALLGDALVRNEARTVPAGTSWGLAPVDLWSDSLREELLGSEEAGPQGSVAHALATVEARHGAKLTANETRLLRAVVLGSKSGLRSSDRADATSALGEIAGLSASAVAAAVSTLRDDYNVLEWDEAFKEFNILGDAVPRTQFLAFVRQRVASAYDEAGKGRLFASKALRWTELLGDVECDFAEENRITTREWRFRGAPSNPEQLGAQIKLAAEQWKSSVGVDEPRGTVVYCYTERSRDVEALAAQAERWLRAAAKESAVAAVPLLVVLLFDADGQLGQAMAEMSILEDGLTNDDRAKFGHLIAAHQEKLRQTIRDSVEKLLKQRRYITGLKEQLEASRLDRACNELFARIYQKPLTFPFDGFTTARGNAADTCQELTVELLTGRLDYDSVMAKPIKSKNRAVTVLADAWRVFAKDGSISRRPSYLLLKSLTERWDEQLNSKTKRLAVGEAVKELCFPPYAGNIASAGLALGVFVAPRVEKLAVVRDGTQVALNQWVQDGAFRGKFIDLAALQEVELVYLGETPSEWQTLLDEWEQAQSHLDRKSGLERANALKRRIPVPPAVAYRFQMLEQQAVASVQALVTRQKEFDDALEKMEKAILKDDVSGASWGAADLKKIQERTLAEKPLWTDVQASQYQSRYEHARQWIIQSLPEWLQRQVPRGDNPAAVGDFEHKMVRLLGGNLKTIGLESQFQDVQTHTLRVIRNAKSVADATQLVRDVETWLAAGRDAIRTARMSRIRALRETGKEYGEKLRETSERLSLPQLGAARTHLTEFLGALQAAEAAFMKRTESLWHARLESEDDIERLLPEVESLVTAFEGLQDDQEDLVGMRKALRLYQQAYQQLGDEHLTWPDFSRLAEELRAEATTALVDDEPPWDPEETFELIVNSVTTRREDMSEAWTSTLEEDARDLAQLSVAEASRIHSRASYAPAVLASVHETRVAKVVKNLEDRLSELQLEWLLEKFKALSEPLQKKFRTMLDGAI